MSEPKSNVVEVKTKQVTNWKAVGIGTLVGLAAVALLLIWFEENFGWNVASLSEPELESFLQQIPLLLFVFLPWIVGAIAGAVRGSRKKSGAAIWIGSILGLILGIIAEIVFLTPVLWNFH